ncbi:92d2bbde-163f-4fa5-bdd0-e4ac3ffd95cd [Thermothielavioides terrestris]|uniref:92d2bbde-163f-4fa5-bdd0-e4ac3ffd95cd n=1 Tax=Thermothielavioides terrestris TaxID=2587410 RepID=A0A3S4ARG8_9PEZI|nr:92d2bbde-163f-4fa5-bdd0-e4ac3ffd95cd [Thermothielavioides terrestris]
MSPSSAPPSAEPVVTFSSGRDLNTPPDLRLLHFNDVYHLDPSSAEPAGGAARFVTVCKEYREAERFRGQPELVTLFSGDVFNPSLESSITKGSHMVPLLNLIGTDCACVGNHDLDFGVLQFGHLASQCRFPWLLANVLDPALGADVPLGGAAKTHMLTASNGLRIGLLGLGEREWLETVNALPPGVVCRPAAEVARELVPQLRAHGADLVVALTHMREPGDLALAEQLAGTDAAPDLILGGHDHFYSHSLVRGRTHVLRSGSDFKQLSYLELRRAAADDGSGRRWDVDIWRRDVVRAVREDAETLALVDRLTAKLKKSLEKPVGFTAAPLDARFTTVRLRESNLGNFVCDLMRHHYGAECALMAAGTIRGDQVYPPGPIRVRDVTDCFPFEDPIVVIKVSGRAIWDALENGVSLYPALEGRFPQVSNIRFTFDPSRPPGSRIVSAEIGGAPLDPGRVYVLATRGYMGRGKDGYRSLLVRSEGGECEELVSEENGILISTMLRQYFMSLTVLARWKRWGPALDRHWSRVAEGVHESHPVVGQPLGSPPAGDAREGRPGHETSANEASGGGGWAEWTPARLRQRRASIPPMLGSAEDDSEDESAGEDGERARQRARDLDRQLAVMRRVFRKWCRLARVHGKNIRTCDSLAESECDVGWTRAIAPRVEGRIRMVTGSAAPGTEGQ